VRLQAFKDFIFRVLDPVTGVPTSDMDIPPSEASWNGFCSTTYPSYHLTPSPLQSSGYTPFATDISTLAENNPTSIPHHLTSGQFNLFDILLNKFKLGQAVNEKNVDALCNNYVYIEFCTSDGDESKFTVFELSLVPIF
jgi:hypothetical protein